jgi:hypothetical protein
VKGIVRNNAPDQSYQMIGGAILPCDLDTGHLTGTAIAALDCGSADDKSERVAQSLRQNVIAPPAATVPLAAQRKPQKPVKPGFGPGQVVRSAKERIRVIKAELKHHEALKRELAELERLVSAAKRPVAIVRDIRRSG